jgi:hypothetical protein
MRPLVVGPRLLRHNSLCRMDLVERDQCGPRQHRLDGAPAVFLDRRPFIL